jgi:phosphatidylinositol alpha-mannosyltransferase
LKTGEIALGLSLALPASVRIAIVSEFYYPHTGGVTEHVHHLAAHLAARGHDVRIITSHVEGAPRRPDRELISRRREVVRIGRGMPIEANGSQARITVGFGLDRKMISLLADCDLVHVQSPLFPVLPLIALKAANKLGIPTVGTFHTHFQPTVASAAFGGFMQSWAGALDAAIAVSPSAARSVKQLSKCVVIPNGVDCAAWANAKPYAVDKPTVVFLGRLDPRNDLEVLLQAIAKMDAQLIVIGDGPCRPPSAPKNVRFVGSKQDVSERARILASAHVMAFCARIVSHPMALLEGLAAGLPAVAYDIEGVRELVTEGRHGYKVPVGDCNALQSALERVLENDERRFLMSREARRQAARYDWKIVGARIEEVYAAALGSRLQRGAA